MQKIEINTGATLNVVDQGDGHPILLLHGFPLDHTMWQHQIAELSKTHRVIAPDLRGFGESSEITADTFHMRDFAEDAISLLDALGIDVAITLCGLSMGGYISLELMELAAERVKRLILCDTRATADPPEVARGRQLMAANVLADGMAGVSDNMIPKLFAPQAVSENTKAVQSTKAVIDSAQPSAVAAAQRGMAERRDLSDPITKFAVPTLVICGEHDAITTSSEMQQMATRIQSARFVQIANAGHMAPLENPIETNRAIID